MVRDAKLPSFKYLEIVLGNVNYETDYNIVGKAL